jgi:hypothetical protein
MRREMKGAHDTFAGPPESDIVDLRVVSTNSDGSYSKSSITFEILILSMIFMVGHYGLSSNDVDAMRSYMNKSERVLMLVIMVMLMLE